MTHVHLAPLAPGLLVTTHSPASLAASVTPPQKPQHAQRNATPSMPALRALSTQTHQKAQCLFLSTSACASLVLAAVQARAFAACALLVHSLMAGLWRTASPVPSVTPRLLEPAACTNAAPWCKPAPSDNGLPLARFLPPSVAVTRASEVVTSQQTLAKFALPEHIPPTLVPSAAFLAASVLPVPKVLAVPKNATLLTNALPEQNQHHKHSTTAVQTPHSSAFASQVTVLLSARAGVTCALREATARAAVWRTAYLVRLVTRQHLGPQVGKGVFLLLRSALLVSWRLWALSARTSVVAYQDTEVSRVC